MKRTKMSLATMNGKMSRSEMRKIMAGSGAGCDCGCKTDLDCGTMVCSKTVSDGDCGTPGQTCTGIHKCVPK